MGMALVVHGGAGTITQERVEVAQAGCKDALLLGWRMLQEGASALDVVEATVRALEDNPNFNAGTGSCLTADGRVEMDAGIMEGHTLRAGAIACVDRIKNPIVLARHVLESPHVLLTARGAHQFAQEQGIAFCRSEDLVTARQYLAWQLERERRKTAHKEEPRIHRIEHSSIDARPEQTEPINKEEKHGTVGAVALDSFGTLAAATSTGGFLYKYPGRVGDSPLVGCGFYADENAAVSCTGYGEDFIRLLIAKYAADQVARGMHAREAAEAAIAYLGAKTNGTGGLIVVDRHGNTGYAWNSSHMVHSYITQEMTEPMAGV